MSDTRGHHRAVAVSRIAPDQDLAAGSGGAGGADRLGDHAPGALARVGPPGPQPQPGDHRSRTWGADRGGQRGQSFAQDLFAGDLGA